MVPPPRRLSAPGGHPVQSACPRDCVVTTLTAECDEQIAFGCCMPLKKTIGPPPYPSSRCCLAWLQARNQLAFFPLLT